MVPVNLHKFSLPARAIPTSTPIKEDKALAPISEESNAIEVVSTALAAVQLKSEESGHAIAEETSEHA